MICTEYINTTYEHMIGYVLLYHTIKTNGYHILKLNTRLSQRTETFVARGDRRGDPFRPMYHHIILIEYDHQL